MKQMTYEEWRCNRRDAGCTLTIRMPDGLLREWGIGAAYGYDTEDSLRAHVAKWVPGAELVSWRWWDAKTGETLADPDSLEQDEGAA